MRTIRAPGWRTLLCGVAGVALIGLGLTGAALAQQSATRPYDVVTETEMPHLEENLRYATRHERLCLDTHELSTAFWMLGEPSLQDCKLVKAGQDAGSASYGLECNGGHGTTGEAHWQFEDGRLSGTLRVRLGGKNMTFYQRIIAVPASNAAGC